MMPYADILHYCTNLFSPLAALFSTANVLHRKQNYAITKHTSLVKLLLNFYDYLPHSNCNFREFSLCSVSCSGRPTHSVHYTSQFLCLNWYKLVWICFTMPTTFIAKLAPFISWWKRLNVVLTLRSLVVKVMVGNKWITHFKNDGGKNSKHIKYKNKQQLNVRGREHHDNLINDVQKHRKQKMELLEQKGDGEEADY